jgi:hypothetical protein
MTSKLERSLQMSSVVMRAAAPVIVSLPQEICHLIFLTSSPPINVVLLFTGDVKTGLGQRLCYVQMVVLGVLLLLLTVPCWISLAMQLYRGIYLILLKRRALTN